MRRTLGILLTFLSLSVLPAACGETKAPTPPISTSRVADDANPAAADARRVEVAARSFAFGPNEITVKVGEDISIVLSSRDSLHDLVLDDFGTRVAAQAGKTSVGGLRAEKPGRYIFYCSVTGHRRAGMQGTLVVEG